LVTRMTDQLPPPDPLFLPYMTHIEVRCWKCKHVATFYPDQLPEGITGAAFTERAKCKCGAGWPEIVPFPKIESRW